MTTKTALAKSKVYEIKLQGIAGELEKLDDKHRLNGLSQREDILYDELMKSYKGTAMAWIRFRKAHNLATDMIAVNWS